MEKHAHVFERFATYDNLYDGYLLARRNKRYNDNVLEYSANLEENLIDAVNQLQWKTYKPGKLNPFYEYFPKVRLIHSAPFFDRVVNCAAYLQLWPIYAKSFYEHSYGSVPNRGTLKAVHQLQSWMQLVMRKPGRWFLGKMDVQKLYKDMCLKLRIADDAKPLFEITIFHQIDNKHLSSY